MNSLNILLVEDDTLVADDLRETLETAGHRITAIARNRPEALRALRRQTPDLTILDVHLEGTADGITTAQDLLNLHPMPIIYLTAHSERPTFQRAKETLPAAYLLKPFDQAELPLQIELAYQHHLLNRPNPGENRSAEARRADPATAERVFLPFDKGHEKLLKSDVLFLRAAGSYTNLTALGYDEPRLLTMNLGYLSQFFTTPNFYRVSRSLLVNLDHVSRVERGLLLLDNHAVPLPIPEGNQGELLKKLSVVRSR